MRKRRFRPTTGAESKERSKLHTVTVACRRHETGEETGESAESQVINLRSTAPLRSEPSR